MLLAEVQHDSLCILSDEGLLLLHLLIIFKRRIFLLKGLQLVIENRLDDMPSAQT